MMAALVASKWSKRLAVGAAIALALDFLRRRLSRALLRKLLGLPQELWPMDEWVNLHREDALEPDVEIVDAHHHLWDPRTQPKGWGIPSWALQVFFFIYGPRAINEFIKADMLKNDPRVLSCFGQRQLPFTQPYMGEEFELDIRNRSSARRGHNIVQTVYVECDWKDTSVNEALKAVGEAYMAWKSWA
ncbi:unnamed protein product [Polarella glacialis]|uniref:Uncharacterized protein n=1 Tax=Polarella glacialis TaxID=89957 RepID=A0A813JJK1_POLGL|nr:unnamed protein product [Polarella glacialis]